MSSTQHQLDDGKEAVTDGQEPRTMKTRPAPKAVLKLPDLGQAKSADSVPARPVSIQTTEHYLGRSADELVGD